MNFSEIILCEDPVSELFDRAHSIVFDDDDEYTEHLSRLSLEARLVYLVVCFDSEIHNGGFEQFFFNSLGGHCSELVGCLEELGAKASLGLLKTAMSCFPNGEVPNNWESRQELWMSLSNDESIEEVINKLDSVFYKYEDNIGKLLENYIENHPDAEVRV